MDDRPINVFLFGSCVGRDMYELVGKNERMAKLSAVARQSLISAGNIATTDGFRLDKLKSKFQRTMVLRDFQGSLFRSINHVADKIDLILIDLVDERRGVFRLSSGGYFTKTRENEAALIESYASLNGNSLDFLDPEFIIEFESAMNRFKELLVEAELLEKTLVLDIPLALAFDPEDSEIDRSRATQHLKWAPAMNERLLELYSMMGSCGFPTAGLSGEKPLMGSGHKWGQAPFHYQLSTYERMNQSVMEFVRQDGDRNP